MKRFSRCVSASSEATSPAGAAPRSSAAMPTMAVSGVRRSWLTEESKAARRRSRSLISATPRIASSSCSRSITSED